MPITIYPPIPISASITGVVQSTLAPNAAQEMAGQLQRAADFLESILIELRVTNELLAQQSNPITDSPEQLRNDQILNN